jgi:hypothetical protein
VRHFWGEGEGEQFVTRFTEFVRFSFYNDKIRLEKLGR